ncbi:MAG: hypothetical protein D6723_15210 [Acidobacteria bacterium]|nr:MAG: hypothetical protein D6723_15210 [Acidobacteriota bacterium]
MPPADALHGAFIQSLPSSAAPGKAPERVTGGWLIQGMRESSRAGRVHHKGVAHGARPNYTAGMNRAHWRIFAFSAPLR